MLPWDKHPSFYLNEHHIFAKRYVNLLICSSTQPEGIRFRKGGGYKGLLVSMVNSGANLQLKNASIYAYIQTYTCRSRGEKNFPNHFCLL